MRPDHRPTAARGFRAGRRPGFALPLALLALVVLSLVVALLLDGALQELRASRGEGALVRAQAASASALAELLSAPADSAFLLLPRGASRTTVRTAAGDTVRVTLQSLGGGLARAVVAARSWSGGAGADATTLAWFWVLPDSAPAVATLRFRRLPGSWWAPLP